ncbi:MAG: PaaI family thioesterase [Candidatus Zixiibacteriota bacterium]|nr:MAG: PaaI family thioesterase [candidate division Zixibacteria bacterium]
MKEIAAYTGCFVCGQDNNIGLKARFFYDGEKAVCDITAHELYTGYKDIYHGGIVMTLMDEVMIKALLAEEVFVVTAEITVRLKRPVYSGDRLHFEGRKTRQKKDVIYFTEGVAVNQDGVTVAEATGRYVRPKNDLSGKLRQSVQGKDAESR